MPDGTTYTMDAEGTVSKIVLGKLDLGDYTIPVTVTVDNWVKNASAEITVHVVSPLTLNGEDITAESKTVTIKEGEKVDLEISSDYYAYMDKNSDASFIVMAAYNDGSGWKQRREDETAADIVTVDYDEIKDGENFQANEPKYEVIGAPEGLIVELINEKPIGYSGLTYTSDINTGLKISGTENLAKGTYTFTIRLTTYIQTKPTGGSWIRAGAGTKVVVEQTITIVVE
jgi:hypothetical protein